MSNGYITELTEEDVSGLSIEALNALNLLASQGVESLCVSYYHPTDTLYRLSLIPGDFVEGADGESWWPTHWRIVKATE